MPLGNLTSQFFANIYLNELDYFVKHNLKARYYLRYVDDFLIVSSSEEQLEIWKEQIGNFLQEKLGLQLHPDKSHIISLSNGIDFVGFRNYYHCKLLRERNIRKMIYKLNSFENGCLSYQNLTEIFQGWQAHAKWANTFKLRKSIAQRIGIAKYKLIEEIIQNNKSSNTSLKI